MVSPPRGSALAESGVPSVCVRFGIKPSVLLISEKLKPGDAALGNPRTWGQRGRRYKIVWTLLSLPLYGSTNGTQVSGMGWQDRAPQPPKPALPAACPRPGSGVRRRTRERLRCHPWGTCFTCIPWGTCFTCSAWGTCFTCSRWGTRFTALRLCRSKAASDSLLQITQVSLSRQIHLTRALSDQIITQQTQAVPSGNAAGLALTRSRGSVRYDKYLCILNK